MKIEKQIAKAAMNDPQNAYRMEMVNIARRLFINALNIAVTEAFELAEKFTNAKKRLPADRRSVGAV